MLIHNVFCGEGLNAKSICIQIKLVCQKKKWMGNCYISEKLKIKLRCLYNYHIVILFDSSVITLLLIQSFAFGLFEAKINMDFTCISLGLQASCDSVRALVLSYFSFDS
jgi:hypothetical protein